MKTLEIKPLVRYQSGIGMDYHISGRSLYLDLQKLDGNAGSPWLPDNTEIRDMLLLKTPSDMPSGRVPLYVCSLCGDLGCGAVTVRISQQGNSIIWSEFGFEYNYDDEFWPPEPLGPFQFQLDQYQNTIQAFARLRPRL